uniref:Protein KRI1 homolog n=1 Tax=Phallusia mammillata TaxID=59560 RepID=A0A6F9DGU9_9ASCI|nr:protein KRI1 homolog [Phallusia mammillata]
MTMEELTINESFAKKYVKYRKAEELQRLKDKYGQQDSSSSESEDEQAEAINKKLEADFFKTIACLKRKDPVIYNKDAKFFADIPVSSNSGDEDTTEEASTKPVLLKDYERDIFLKHKGVYKSEEQEQNDDPGSYSHELNQIKKSLLDATEQGEDGSDDEEELFKPKESKSDGSRVGSTLEELDEYWRDPDLPEDETFLRDYILQHKYLDNEDHAESDEEALNADDSDNDSSGGLFVQKQETFERQYNFRYEEPDAELIKSYPRTIANSVRMSDNKTKKKREERKKRKEDEKRKKMEELKRLKQLKREEILEKINKLQEATGNTDIKFSAHDLEGDFNESEYDQRMKELFDENFYDETDDVKPEFSDHDDDNLEPNWDEYTGCDELTTNGGKGIPDSEQPDFNMDCDYEPKNNSKQKVKKPVGANKRNKKRSAFFEAVAKTKPVFDPDACSFDKYLEDYYALDFEDIIGDMPCRFKYRKVAPQTYGLTTDEILTADNRTLNSWCSLKRVVQHRSAPEEMVVRKKFARKARLKKKRHFEKPATDDHVNANIAPEDNTLDTAPKKRKLNSKQRRRKKERETRLRVLAMSNQHSLDGKKKVGFTKKQRGKNDARIAKVTNMDAERLKAYGIKPKKLVNKLKYGNQTR